MAEFLVELYFPRDGAAAVQSGAERTRLAAEELTSEGTRARFVRSIFVPEDETCFFVCEADSEDAVREVARRAGLSLNRISRAAIEPNEPA